MAVELHDIRQRPLEVATQASRLDEDTFVPVTGRKCLAAARAFSFAHANLTASLFRLGFSRQRTAQYHLRSYSTTSGRYLLSPSRRLIGAFSQICDITGDLLVVVNLVPGPLLDADASSLPFWMGKREFTPTK